MVINSLYKKEMFFSLIPIGEQLSIFFDLLHRRRLSIKPIYTTHWGIPSYKSYCIREHTISSLWWAWPQSLLIAFTHSRI